LSDPFHDPAEEQCHGGCPGCSRQNAGRIGPGGLTGWRLSFAAGLALLLPLVLAVAGTVAVRRIWPGDATGHADTAGAVAGLIAGLLIAVWLGRCLARRAPEPAADDAPSDPDRCCDFPDDREET
jgi:hypothetical protein